MLYNVCVHCAVSIIYHAGNYGTMIKSLNFLASLAVSNVQEVSSFSLFQENRKTLVFSNYLKKLFSCTNEEDM